MTTLYCLLTYVLTYLLTYELLGKLVTGVISPFSRAATRSLKSRVPTHGFCIALSPTAAHVTDSHRLTAMPTSGLSKYERERLDNIRRKQEHLAYLGLEAAPSAAAARRETKRPRRDPSLHPQVAPSRSSARIERASAPDVFVESETGRGIETVGGDGGAQMAEHQAREISRTAAAAALGPLAAVGLGAMPASESDLLDCEREAYAALRAAKNARAGAEGTAAYHIAQNRTLCELVRRVPTTADELQACWGFGGGGGRLERHGAFFLEALAPFVPALRKAHAAARQPARGVPAEAARHSAAAAAPPPLAGGLRMEVACCDADHEGEWEGEWEECEVVADHGETCDVRIVEDGEVCCGVPRRLVRAALEAGPRSLATGSANRLVRRRSRIEATAAAVMDALAPMAAAVQGVF